MQTRNATARTRAGLERLREQRLAFDVVHLEALAELPREDNNLSRVHSCRQRSLGRGPLRGFKIKLPFTNSSFFFAN